MPCVRTRVLIAATLLLVAACAPQTPTPAPTAGFTPPPASPVPTLAAPVVNAPTSTPTSFSGVIRGATAYVRDHPSTMGTIIRTANEPAPVMLVGRTYDNVWLQVIFNDQSSGWVLAQNVNTQVELSLLQITGVADNTPNVALVSASAAHGIPLQESPSDNAAAVTQLAALTPLRIISQLSDNSWMQVITAEGKQGWVATVQLDLSGVSPSNIPAITVTPAPTAAQATVSDTAGGLRLRQLPSTDGLVLFNLPAGTPLTIQGRTANNSWLLVQIPEGYTGWVVTSYLNVTIDLTAIPVVDNPQPAPYVEVSPPPGAPQVSSGISGGARTIFEQGQSLGNRADVFTTVGDSLTDTPDFLRAFVFGYNLHDYGYLLPALQYFSADGNSFNNISRSSRASWSTFSVLDPKNADPGTCQSGETPLACELRVSKPAVALIMIGTNDAPAFPPSQYQTNMTQIIETIIQAGVVPVISTLPPRAQYNDNVIAYNQVLAQLAQTYDVPLWEFYNAVVTLPNRGIGPDGVHLSIPPGAPSSTTDFTADNLQFGTTMRNLTALQILDTLWKQALS